MNITQQHSNTMRRKQFEQGPMENKKYKPVLNLSQIVKNILNTNVIFFFKHTRTQGGLVYNINATLDWLLGGSEA